MNGGFITLSATGSIWLTPYGGWNHCTVNDAARRIRKKALRIYQGLLMMILLWCWGIWMIPEADRRILSAQYHLLADTVWPLSIVRQGVRDCLIVTKNHRSAGCQWHRKDHPAMLDGQSNLNCQKTPVSTCWRKGLGDIAKAHFEELCSSSYPNELWQD